MKTKFGKFTVFLLATGFLAFASVAGATTISYTDNGTYGPSLGGDNPITYTLSYAEIDPTSYQANFTVETGAGGSPDWRLLGLAFNFAPKGGVIDSTSIIGPKEWVLLPSDDPFNTPDGWSGVYDKNVKTKWDVGPGLLLTDGLETYTWQFDVLFSDADHADTIFGTDMPFQAYFAGVKEKDVELIAKVVKKVKEIEVPKGQHDQLSETLRVPEPSTMLLLGLGLVGLAGIKRRKLRK